MLSLGYLWILTSFNNVPRIKRRNDHCKRVGCRLEYREGE